VGAPWPWPYPLSASGLIFDLQGYSNDAANNHDILLLDPNFATVPRNCSRGTAQPQSIATIHLASKDLAGPAMMGMRAVVPTTLNSATTTITIALCDPALGAGAYVGVSGIWIGYIEPVHHLNTIR